MRAVIEIEGLEKVYNADRPDIAVRAVDGVGFSVNRGESVAIVGSSGCGKSTLLQLLGCLDRPTAGHYQLDGRDVARLEDDELAAVRNRSVGFIFQSFQLLPRLDALENVELPLTYAARAEPPARRRSRALESLQRVGLSDRAHHLPNELSGGQKQRVAIARALVTNPAILLCDEPTGALDSKTGKDVLGLLADLHNEGATLLVVTHDLAVARAMDRAMWMQDGHIQADGPAGDVVSAFARAQEAAA